MRARFVNEIKREVENPLTAMGVGRVEMLKGYKYLNNHFVWAHSAKLMSSTFKNEKYKKLINRIESKFDINTKKFLWIPVSSYVDKKYEMWLEGLTFDKKISIQEHPEWKFKDSKIVVKFNTEYRIGYILISDMEDMPDRRGYFVEYL